LESGVGFASKTSTPRRAPIPPAGSSSAFSSRRALIACLPLAQFIQKPQNTRASAGPFSLGRGPIPMKLARLLATALFVSVAALRADEPANAKPEDDHKPTKDSEEVFTPEQVITNGTLAGIDYQAVAGTLVVHPKGWDDVKDKENNDNPTAVASMFYVAYIKKGATPTSRPITFLYNGGPGSATVWLHMGAFGPKRVVTADDSHTPAAPYQVVENDSSLLDVSDLVFIDAPGTGFSRLAGRDKEKAFFGVDPDAYAFSQFIQQFLSKYGRWNSPKYLFGESYGTPRSAVLVNLLETEDDVDVNGVILLSQILNFDLDADAAEGNPANDLPYEVALPTYAATAWYHQKLPGERPADLEKFLREVEHFAMTDYALALQAGATLPADRRDAIAEKLHAYTGLSVAYIKKANLRITGGEFEKNLQDDANLTTGRLDTRFSGPTLDPLSKESDYDPQSAAISSAYVSAFNDYVRTTLNYGHDRHFKPTIPAYLTWDFKHQQPGEQVAFPRATNTIPDLSVAMKYNPSLKILLLGGYFDIATPYFEGVYEMRHLQIPQNLQANISYHYYQSGHMVYANEAALKQLHADVAAFIRSTDNVKD
jgi:carboxypeptidase C (cathepsin A)